MVSMETWKMLQFRLGEFFNDDDDDDDGDDDD
jgi:hypothetical protein